MMFSFDDAAASGAAVVNAARGFNSEPVDGSALRQTASSSVTPQTLVFVDRAIADIDTLLQGLESSKVVVIERHDNGVAKIADTLLHYDNLESVQVFSHGRKGQLQLGSAQLNAQSLGVHADDLAQWGRSLSPLGDLLLYGCNVAAGEAGSDFLTQMGLLTEADIAASTNLTGAGGDWTLEAAYGQIEAEGALSAIAKDSFSSTLNSLKNLLNNGDFESGLLPWSWWGGYRDGQQIASEQAASGQNSLRLSSQQSGVGQVVEASAGTTYRLSGQAKSSSNGYSTFGLKFLNENNQEIARLDIGSINSSDWQAFELTGTAPMGTTRVQAFGFKWDEQGDTFIDGVSLNAIGNNPVVRPPGPQPLVISNINNSPAAEKVSVFLLGGQSNMVGLGRNSELPSELQDPNPNVQIWQDNSRSFINLQPGFSAASGNGPEFGPELTFGQGIQGYRGNDVYLVKHATGSTNLYSDWDPDGSNNLDYDTFVNRVDTALADLRGQNIDYSIEGMLWMQGEADSYNAEAASAYRANLTAFVQDMRDRYGSQLKFAVGRLHNDFNTGYDDVVRDAQYSVAAADGLTAVVPTDGFGLYGDNVHYNTAGQIALGYQFANVLKNGF